jgi:hypothetical protein
VSTTFSPARTASCRLVAGPQELAAHFAVRRAVFVDAQRLFEDDRDERDADALHVVALAGDEVIGAVRLYRIRWPGRCGRATGSPCCRAGVPARSS